ncbi:hypothetical protein B296_00000098 [Ensete ventricosum]|uniref:Uncharacterized protein n=1 Tax=Ensete ventricosum TaxID=4639 RepID=A0A427B2U1_ENSVE|nr:hypothetical protein B296_00000098 [Ensete ventricosum]
MSDFTLRNNSHLIVGGTSPGTHHPGEGLVLQEQFDEVKRIRIKVTTRASTHINLELPMSGPSCAHDLNPIVRTPWTRWSTHNNWNCYLS